MREYRPCPFHVPPLEHIVEMVVSCRQELSNALEVQSSDEWMLIF
jgi:hypothetical protein